MNIYLKEIGDYVEKYKDVTEMEGGFESSYEDRSESPLPFSFGDEDELLKLYEFSVNFSSLTTA